MENLYCCPTGISQIIIFFQSMSLGQNAKITYKGIFLIESTLFFVHLAVKLHLMDIILCSSPKTNKVRKHVPGTKIITGKLFFFTLFSQITRKCHSMSLGQNAKITHKHIFVFVNINLYYIKDFGYDNSLHIWKICAVF